MNMDNYVGFTLRVPIGLHIVSPMVTSNTILDEFCLQLCTALGADKYKPQRAEIEAALANGSLSKIDRLDVNRAMTSLASETAENICSKFLSMLMAKLEVPQPPIAVPSEAQAKKELNTFAQNNLAGFTQLSPEKIQDTAAKAAAKVQTVAARYSIPAAAVTKAAQLAFYDFILLCDDSASMGSDTRIPTLEASIRGLFKAARLLNSETQFSVYTFGGPRWENLRTEPEMEKVVSSLTYQTGEKAAGPLKSRVLQPLLQKASEKKLNPTVVVVITDGDIGNVSDFSNTIAKFKSQMNYYQYDGPAVLFLICRVGNDNHAAQSLKQLKANPIIKDILFYSEDSLDLKLQQMQGNTDAYVGMVIEDLIQAMELQVTKTSYDSALSSVKSAEH
ncbi:hypothetical protein K432DRAFT_397027 [Lepidopterella palustris CBS 459.81]|uniref:VWFA domain-containing protein n=1 Tax=Lepidopterella palustris CBS 459.81 TaxID=1314670 RepID=A0A8E2JAV6_9PEZI|nr:hypothetical protein K432DRAFT_397027 [Lepidopterella palustris CBS 459.81]